MQAQTYIMGMPPATLLVALLAAALLSILVMRVTRWLWKYAWLPRRSSGTRLAERYGRGSWALVTGASDGLGKAFAAALAQQGFNVVLVARTPAKLDSLKLELERLGVEVRTVCADLSDASDATYASIDAALHALELAIVINCVGVTVHRRYADIPAATLRKLIAVNVSTTAILTHMLLPALLRHATQSGRRSALLNVGSIVGRFPWPGTQLYGACKAFIDHLTVPLAFEYREQLDVLSFQPTVMATPMAKAGGVEPAAITIPPQAAAHAALAHLGRYTSSHGHWRHALLAALFERLPAPVRNRVFLKGALQMAEFELANEP